MLDYKDIIVKHFGLGMSGRQIARELGVSKSGVNDVLGAFKRCESLDFPLPDGITNYGIANYGIAAKIYGGSPGAVGRDMTYACPDFEEIHKQLHERKNMTLVYLWNRYMKICEAEGRKGYQYRQFCKQYSRWCETNKESMHITAVSGQKMEVDFAGKTFQMVEHLNTNAGIATVTVTGTGNYKDTVSTTFRILQIEDPKYSLVTTPFKAA